MSSAPTASAPMAAPNFVHATLSIARLTMLRIVRGRKLWVAGIAAAVVILFPAFVALSRDEADREALHEAVTAAVSGGIDWGFFRLLVFLLPILFTSGTVGEEVEGRTLHFLAMRPLPRAAIALGKYLVGTATGLVVLWVALILLHVVSYAATPSLMIDQLGETAQAGGAASMLLVLYSAICLFWGTLVPEAGGMLSIVWLGFVEWFVGLLPGVFRFGSMTHWARELGGIEAAGWGEITIGPGDPLVSVPVVETWIMVLVPVVEWALFLGFALLIMQTAQLRFGKA